MSAEAGAALPGEVRNILYVGRIVERDGPDGELERGVVKYLHRLTFGQGQQHDGLRCVHRRTNFEAQEWDGEGEPMDTDFQFAVFWEGRQEPEVMSLEEVREVATDRFTEEEWLPAIVRDLIEDGWGPKLDSFNPDNIDERLNKRAKEADGEAKSLLAAAKRAAQPKKAAKQKGPAKPRAPKAPKAPKAAGKGGAKKAAKPKAEEPLQKPVGVAEMMQQKKEALKRKIAEQRAAAAQAGSPAKKPVALVGALAPARRDSVAAVPPASAQQPSAGRRASGAASGAAAASAHVEPSPCVGSPGAAGGEKKRKQQQQQQEGPGTADGNKKRRQQEEGAGKGKQAHLPALLQAGGSGAKAAAAGAGASARSQQSGGSAEKDVFEPVLRQFKQKEMHPRDSKRIRDDSILLESVEGQEDLDAKVAWYDLVRAADGKLYRVYSKNLIVPDDKCFRPRTKDRRLSRWKTMAQDPDKEYVVEHILAEEERETENEYGELETLPHYMIKYAEFEADPDDDGWQTEDGMGDCQELMAAWRRDGRAAWQAASRRVRQEAGIKTV